MWSTDPNHLHILSTTDFDGICLDAEMEATLVGHTLSTKRVAGRHLQDDRTDKGIIRAARIRVLPIMLAAKARLAAMVVIPTTLCGTQWTWPTNAKIRRLRTAIVKLLFGVKRLRRCPEIVTSVLHQSHEVDPIRRHPVHDPVLGPARSRPLARPPDQVH